MLLLAGTGMTDFYREIDPRDIPTYSIDDAAHFLRIPRNTIRSWTAGRNYKTLKGLKTFKPLIPTPNRKPRLLSFTNLIEIHVLRAIRKHHNIQISNVREALDFVEERFEVSHPLAREAFRTDGVDLFIKRYGSLINASKSGKEELKASFSAHLERIEPDNTGLAIKLYPFTLANEEDNPKSVVIDPRIAFGRLVIVGTGIATDVLAERFEAGDSIEELAYDYELDRNKIEEAIRYEMLAA